MTDDFKKATQVTEVVEIESEGSSKVDYDIMRSEDSENDEPDTDWENEQLKPNFLLSKPIQEPVITLDSESEINDNPDVEYVKLNFDTSDDEEIKIEWTKIKPKFVDFSSFPSSFKSSEKALEKYNELGILHNLYFVIKDSNKGTKNHFELKCHIQNWNVIVKFNYDEETEHYRRIEGYNIIHSHFLEKFEIYSFDQATTEEVNRAYLEDPTIKAVEFSKTLSNIINRKVEPFEGLLILNKIKEKYRVDYSMLALDWQTIQNYDNEAYIVINKGDLTVMFLQTKFMAEHLQHNAYSILVSVSKDKWNKYGFYTILFSSITIFGQTVSCGLGFMNIKWVDSYSWVFAKFLEKASTLLNGKYPPVIIVPFEGDVIAASLNTFGDVSKIYWNHFYIMNTVKSLLSPFILKSDGMAKEVYHLSHRILSEQNEKKWLLLEEKIVENLGFDKNIEKWYEKFFFDQKEFWKMTTKDEMFYTGGLHTSYRAELVEKHFFSHLKQSSGFYDMLKQLIKVQYYDFSLEIKESETVRIKTHPVYVAVKRSFTKYGVSFMTKEIIKSFNHDIEVIEEETKYKIKEKNSIGGRSFKVKKEKSRIRNGNFTNIEITCNWSFYKTHLMICAHIF